MFEELQNKIDEMTVKAINAKTENERTSLVHELDRLQAKQEVFMTVTKVGDL